jgi:N-acetylneuraminic acid mutarotase
MIKHLSIVLMAVACSSSGSDEGPKRSTSLDDTGSGTTDCSERSYTVPSTRGEAAGVWDTERQRFVFFGGDEGTPISCIPKPEFVSEVWAFHTDCDSFELIETTGDGPSARSRHAVALDAKRNQMLVHGGRYREAESGAYTLYDELWALDLGTDSWSLLATGGPSKRVTHTMVVADDALLLYGGNLTTSSTSYLPGKDLWSFDLAGDEGWTGLDGDVEAGVRLFHAGAISEDGKTMYAYGGADENALLGPFFEDLWAYDVQSQIWTELHSGGSSAPDGRIGANLLSDDAQGRLLLWAGHDDGALGNTNQVWAFDLTESTWTELEHGDTYANPAFGFCDFPSDFINPDLDAPERRYFGAAALTDDALIIFGGKTDCGQVNDLWTWDLEDQSWTERSDATFGEICARTFADPDGCESLCY